MQKIVNAKLRNEIPFHLMLLPGVILVLIFSYGSMYGVIIAFQNFIPAKGLFGNQQWVGLDNFQYILEMPNFSRVLFNTLNIAVLKIVTGLIVPVLFAVLLCDIKNAVVKRSVQTLIYLPHFISWVILSGIIIDVLSPSTGIVNQVIIAFGGKPIFFLGDNKYFVPTMVISDVWKEFGFGTIIYIAAICGIDPALYESAQLDGAGKLKQIWHITLPGIRYIIVLMCVLSLGQVLNAGFEQIFNMYSTQVYQTGDIIDTFVYRLGIQEGKYSLATAVGLFKSVISTLLISISYFLAYKYSDYRVF